MIAEDLLSHGGPQIEICQEKDDEKNKLAAVTGQLVFQYQVYRQKQQRYQKVIDLSSQHKVTYSFAQSLLAMRLL